MPYISSNLNCSKCIWVTEFIFVHLQTWFNSRKAPLLFNSIRHRRVEKTYGVVFDFHPSTLQISFTHVQSQNWQQASLQHIYAEMNALCGFLFHVVKRMKFATHTKWKSVTTHCLEQFYIEMLACYFIPWVYIL